MFSAKSHMVRRGGGDFSRNLLLGEQCISFAILSFAILSFAILSFTIYFLLFTIWVMWNDWLSAVSFKRVFDCLLRNRMIVE